MSPPDSTRSFEYDVVIPTHGRSMSLLAESIASVERQTLQARRIVVVVDGNAAAAEHLRASHPGIQVVCLEEPSGEAVARQAGIMACEAEWVSFLDDDDLWSPRKQQVTAAYVAVHPGCSAVRAGYWIFAGAEDWVAGINGQAVELHADSLDDLEAAAATAVPLNDLDYLDIEGDSLALMLEFNRGVIGTTTVKREILLAIEPVPRGQRPGADHLLFCHVAAETEWHLIKERLGYYRLHSGQDTRSPDPAGARGILQAKRRAWAAHGSRVTRALDSYGPRYRSEVRRFVWSHLRQRHAREALATYRYALPLLPRLRDRAAALLPDPLVWHARRAIRSWRRIPSKQPEW